MQRTCITINLKRKLEKENIFNEYIEKHILDSNFESIVLTIESLNLSKIYIEEICILNLNKKSEFLKALKDINVECIIITLNSNKLKELQMYGFSNFISLIDDDLLDKILEYETENEVEEINDLQKLKNNTKNLIIGINLDSKVYATTYLINLACEIAKTKHVSYVEVKNLKYQKIIYKNIFNFKDNNIDYSFVDNYLDIDLGQKNDYLILDLSLEYDVQEIYEIIKFKNVYLFAFTTNCLKVNEDINYVKQLRILEKHSNTHVIKKNLIFDKNIQKKGKVIGSKVINKNIIKEYKENNV